MSAWIQLSAGVGPAECALAVAVLTRRLVEEAQAHGLAPCVVETEAGEEAGTWRSALVELADDGPPGWLESWLGTVQWVGRSPFRPHHKRRNWFVDVTAFRPPEPERYPTQALRFEAMRAGGPGGQHQNKTASAVRVTHLPTGLTAIAREGRSQHQNRKLALARLAAALDARRAEGEAEKRDQRWSRHQGLERGNPVRVYEGPDFRRRA